jgi:transcription initiation factor TFIIH subunit 2
MMEVDERQAPLRLDLDDDGDGADEDEAMADRGAFERHYADERSWEELQEDESGMLRPVDVAQQQRQHRKRMAAMAGPHIQRGIIRYLYVLLDFSRVSALSPPPSFAH